MFGLYVYVPIVLLFTQNGYSQKQGEPCVLKHTHTSGFCAPAATCQSARRDYETKRLTPTICNNSLETLTICCSDESSKPNKDAIDKMVGSKNQQMTSDKQRLSEKKCAEYSSRIHNVTILLLVPDSEVVVISIPKCNYNSVELIVGGEDALEGEFPHMAAIGWVNLDGTYSFLCAGSLISTKFILTAAHCTTMRDSNPVIVRLGVVNFDQKSNDDAGPIEISIKNIRKHPQYKASSKYHDIALLELASDIDIIAGVDPACLWNGPDLSEYTRALTTGWRVVDSRTQITSNEMKKVSVRLLENDLCNILLTTDKNNSWNDGLTEKQLCAGTARERKDTGQLNAGSPLQVTSHENDCIFYVIGLTSFGTKSGSPVVYTRVSSYLDWIESVVWPGES